MTREEAIKILEEEAEFLYGGDEPYNKIAFDMAIEALKDRPQGEWKPFDLKHWQATNIKTIDGEPVYDCPFCGEWADENGYCSYGKKR